QRMVRPGPVGEHHRNRAQHLDLYPVPRVVGDALLRIPGVGPDPAEEPAVLVDPVAAIVGVVDHGEPWLPVFARQVRPVARQVMGVDVDLEHDAPSSPVIARRAYRSTITEPRGPAAPCGLHPPFTP